MAKPKAIDRDVGVDAAPAPETGRGLSVVVPVYNEAALAEQLLRKVRAALPDCELIVVDDCSTDGSGELLAQLAVRGKLGIRLFRHEQNRGKGAAMHTGFARATGEYVVVQDADLEYDPADLPPMLARMRVGDVDAVYGSRFLSGGTSALGAAHVLLNRTLTAIGNVITGLRMTDMETCYKMLRTDLLRGITLREQRFGFDPEITIGIAATGGRLTEVPISYRARTFAEGKKIGVRDLLRTFWVLFSYGWARLPGRMLLATLGVVLLAVALSTMVAWLLTL